ncbi:zinc finger BED domain-containing protein RICESLEEPER 2-like [Humulus lupulus]|uniref:zinc finger BED domain-containing protein RICESLEEPER 2-like n=1 Tax=Humulus lupulus TaxID=3486 RepID=UPI002B4097D1|nr:zinc finger BED domain-containing protein RICESLEEPER 2-like [Humulus lupulus]
MEKDKEIEKEENEKGKGKEIERPEKKQRKRIIYFIQVPSHKGDFVGKELINCLNEWGISSIFAVTVDNASSNDAALRKLKVQLLDKDNTIPLNDEMFHMRWNSTYLMIESAIKFKKAFENLEVDANNTKYFDEERMDGPPTNLDWEKTFVFVDFLRRFYDLTNRFSGTLYVTSNLSLPDILKVQANLTIMASNHDTLLGAMVVSMKQKYDKYWGRIEKLNMLTFIVNILDPRYKLEVVNLGFKFVYYSSEAEKMIKLVKNTLAQLYDFYKQQQQPSQSSQAQPSQSQPQPSQLVINSTTESFLQGQLQLSDNIEEDSLEYYLSDRREKLDPAFDILQWWKHNGFKYPIVARMAKDVLVVHMSIVASESDFSTGGRILDSFRSSLFLRMVEALICSKNWYTCECEEPVVLQQYVDEIDGLEACEHVLPDF